MTDSAVGPPVKSRLSRRRVLIAIIVLIFLALPVFLRDYLARTEFALAESPDAQDQPLAGSRVYGCKPDPDPTVLKYPRFASSRPLFASLRYSQTGDGNFVKYQVALDESKGTGSGYDVLYFDANANLDLADDSPLRVADETVSAYDKSPILLFDRITLPCDYGPPVGVRSFGVIPFSSSFRGEECVGFRRDSVRRGTIRIGGRLYKVALSDCGLSGRYDGPGARIHLTRPPHFILFPHRGQLADYIPAQQKSLPLSSFYKVDGRWYSFACTPLGDRLKVTLYEGGVGTFEIAGGLGDAKGAGAISNTDSYIRIAFSSSYEFGWESVKSAELPAGDYFLDNMLVTTGIYEIWLERNSATAGTHRLWRTPQPQHFIAIREGLPFTLSLPDKPSLVFGTPEDGLRLRPGQELTVRSILVIPETDVCIRDMNMRKKPLTVDVAVTDSSGKTLAQGTLPIFDLIYKGFSWQIPEDIEFSGPEERLTVTVTCDTGQLFGKIEGSRQVSVEKPEGD